MIALKVVRHSLYEALSFPHSPTSVAGGTSITLKMLKIGKTLNSSIFFSNISKFLPLSRHMSRFCHAPFGILRPATLSLKTLCHADDAGNVRTHQWAQRLIVFLVIQSPKLAGTSDRFEEPEQPTGQDVNYDDKQICPADHLGEDRLMKSLTPYRGPTVHVAKQR